MNKYSCCSARTFRLRRGYDYGVSLSALCADIAGFDDDGSSLFTGASTDWGYKPSLYLYQNVKELVGQAARYSGYSWPWPNNFIKWFSAGKTEILKPWEDLLLVLYRKLMIIWNFRRNQTATFRISIILVISLMRFYYYRETINFYSSWSLMTSQDQLPMAQISILKAKTVLSTLTWNMRTIGYFHWSDTKNHLQRGRTLNCFFITTGCVTPINRGWQTFSQRWQKFLAA